MAFPETDQAGLFCLLQGETREEAVYKMAEEMLKKLPRWVMKYTGQY
jgi:hypothetical protein